MWADERSPHDDGEPGRIHLRTRQRDRAALHRVRLHERDDFFAEVWDDESMFLGMQMPFYAAHRLHARGLSDAQNAKLFGKCNNPNGHGHRYLTEATIGGEYDKKSGTLYDFMALHGAIKESLAPWQDRHLDLETEDFRDTDFDRRKHRARALAQDRQSP